MTTKAVDRVQQFFEKDNLSFTEKSPESNSAGSPLLPSPVQEIYVEARKLDIIIMENERENEKKRTKKQVIIK